MDRSEKILQLRGVSELKIMWPWLMARPVRGRYLWVVLRVRVGGAAWWFTGVLSAGGRQEHGKSGEE